LHADLHGQGGIQLYGNTRGLSPSATRTLERIYRRRVPVSDISTLEL